MCTVHKKKSRLLRIRSAQLTTATLVLAHANTVLLQQEELENEIQEALDWLDENANADSDEYADKQKEVEAIANPVSRLSIAVVVVICDHDWNDGGIDALTATSALRSRED
jgi:hypothetical protein